MGKWHVRKFLNPSFFYPVIFFGPLIAVLFTNCSPVNFDTAPINTLQEASQDSGLAAGSIQINSGKLFTGSRSATLTITGSNATEMYITDDPSCLSGGTWEPLNKTKSWTLPWANAQNTVYAKFKNLDNESECVQASIIEDEIPPLVTIPAPPVYTNSQTIQFSFSAIDPLPSADVVSSGIDSANMVCEFGLQIIDCNQVGALQCHPDKKGVNVCEGNLNIQNIQSPTGLQQLKVKIKDLVGNQVQITKDWIFDSSPPRINLIQSPSNPTGNVNADFVMTASDDISGLAKISCSVDGEPFQDCSVNGANYTYRKTLAAGAHRFDAVATDKAGNTFSLPTYNWNIDLNQPSVRFTSTPRSVNNLTSAAFAFVGDKNGIAINQFLCSLNGAPAAACNSGSFSYAGPLSQGNNRFSVIGVDSLGNQSAPLVYNWLVDLVAPTVTVVPNFIPVPPVGPVPQTYENSVVFNLTATDQKISASVFGSGVSKIEYSLDGGSWVVFNSAAAETVGWVTPVISNLPLGNHTLNVRATDDAGNITNPAGSYTWTILSSVAHSQTIAANQIDIIFVVDNSLSMDRFQNSLSQYFTNLDSALAGVDWRMAFTTTNVFCNSRSEVEPSFTNTSPCRELPFYLQLPVAAMVPYPHPLHTVITDTTLSYVTDGVFLGLPGLPGQTYLTPATPDLLNVFRKSISLGINGKSYEQAVKAIFRSVERSQLSGPNDAVNRDFFRPSANLVAVKFGEDDESGLSVMNNGTSLVDYIKSIWPNKKFVFSAFYSTLSDTTCPPLVIPQFSAYFKEGNVHRNLAAATSGKLYNICDTTRYDVMMNELGDNIKSASRVVNLQCAPVDTNGDGKQDVSVTLQGGGVVPPFTVTGSVLTFQSNLPSISTKLDYKCIN
jgi:hypothetical protein